MLPQVNRRELIAHLEALSATVNSVLTVANMHNELIRSLGKEEINAQEECMKQQLVIAHSELETARRILDNGGKKK